MISKESDSLLQSMERVITLSPLFFCIYDYYLLNM
nr:MAG TPA: hypothetical protein [Caudoviricetes sp.]